jgi:hypothetical protein
MSFHEIFSREADEAELEQLYRKKYSGLLIFSPEDEISLKKLEARKFNNNQAYRALETPQKPSLISINADFSALTDSSQTSSSSTFSGLSKTSSGYAKVLSQNKACKSHFADIRIADVEEHIFSMNKEFQLAADYHAPFLLFMKCLLWLNFIDSNDNYLFLFY